MSLFGSRNGDSSLDDIQRLTSLCATVSEGINGFRRVGSALAEIRDQELYRLEAGTFEAFCRDRWGMTAQHAGRLMQASAICDELEPIGSIPSSEHQARALGTLAPQKRTAVWQDLQEEKDDDGSIPANAIHKAVSKSRPRKSKAKKGIRLKVPGATVVIIANSKYHGHEETLRFALDKLTVPARKAA